MGDRLSPCIHWANFATMITKTRSVSLPADCVCIFRHRASHGVASCYGMRVPNSRRRDVDRATGRGVPSVRTQACCHRGTDGTQAAEVASCHSSAGARFEGRGESPCSIKGISNGQENSPLITARDQGAVGLVMPGLTSRRIRRCIRRTVSRLPAW